MDDNFTGVIIEESLENKGVLGKVKILKTLIEKVTERHKTPYLKKWTLHTVEIPARDAARIAEEISKSMDSVHDDWYADFKNKKHHYIIFRNKVFRIDIGRKGSYDRAVRYGLSLGIPDYQLSFSTDAE